ncbi:acidic phospholipase A2 PA4 [Drosophila tropicalis]|uniref:acidic phospholipase A2 PA4 n=1 Tax=Drosophila tropicalis TaxID=46794 RepID=UPI0035ABE9A3
MDLMHFICLLMACCFLMWELQLSVGAAAAAAAKQLPLPASIAAVAVTTTTTAGGGGAANQSHSIGISGGSRHERRRRQSDWFIAPNTRWCGRGNLANGTYNHLGGASMADKCCRKHDHCKMWIPGMSNRYDLFNYRPYTLSHCSCDRRFRTCLKMASDEDAIAIGKLFFNIVQTQCFVLKTETVCLERGKGADSDNCIKEEVRHKAFLRNNKKF